MAADAIAQMQRAFLDLDNPSGLIHLLLVVCINEQDTTRPGWSTADQTQGLGALCKRLPDVLEAELNLSRQVVPARSSPGRAPGFNPAGRRTQ